MYTITCGSRHESTRWMIKAVIWMSAISIYKVRGHIDNQPSSSFYLSGECCCITCANKSVKRWTIGQPCIEMLPWVIRYEVVPMLILIVFVFIMLFFLLERMTSQWSCIFRECLIIHTLFIHFILFWLPEWGWSFDKQFDLVLVFIVFVMLA